MEPWEGAASVSSYCWSRRKRRTPWATMLLLGLGQAAMAFVPAPNGHLLARRVVRDSGRPFWLGASSTSGESISPSEAGQEEDGAPRKATMTIESLVRKLYEAEDPLWELLRFEAETCLTQDEQATSLLNDQVMRHDDMDEAAKHLLSTKLLTNHLTLSETRNLLETVYDDDHSIVQHFREDLLACAMRDPSLPGVLAAFLFSKGFHAVATYRVAHSLFLRERESLARFLQSVNSELFGADIHPACSVGRSLFLSSGSCVVIGETARLGDDVVVMQGVTLGGNGKERGDRHPKIGSRVLLAPGATVLGNIAIGTGVIINACSVVVRPVPDFSRCSGVPAKATSLGSSDAVKQKMLEPGHRAYIYVFSESCYA